MGDRGQLGNVIVDGPLSIDVALYKEVADHKKVKGSAVAGDPDCLLFPNIESGQRVSSRPRPTWPAARSQPWSWVRRFRAC